MRLWPRVKSNAGSPDVERCKHVKSQATTVYFRLGKLRRVSTYVHMWWGIIGHVTVEAGNTVGTDGAPPQRDQRMRESRGRAWRDCSCLSLTKKIYITQCHLHLYCWTKRSCSTFTDFFPVSDCLRIFYIWEAKLRWAFMSLKTTGVAAKTH